MGKKKNKEAANSTSKETSKHKETKRKYKSLQKKKELKSRYEKVLNDLKIYQGNRNENLLISSKIISNTMTKKEVEAIQENYNKAGIECNLEPFIKKKRLHPIKGKNSNINDEEEIAIANKKANPIEKEDEQQITKIEEVKSLSFSNIKSTDKKALNKLLITKSLPQRLIRQEFQSKDDSIKNSKEAENNKINIEDQSQLENGNINENQDQNQNQNHANDLKSLNKAELNAHDEDMPSTIMEKEKEKDIFLVERKYFIPCTVKRTEKVNLEKKELPIFNHEFEVCDAIYNNLITLISGKTGCGKSTQVPQFLYERGFTHFSENDHKMICITEPRRIAAQALSKRVAYELNTTIGGLVGYQIRYDTSHVSSKARIKFVTDGILLRELNSDPLLQKYSVIIIDEAHERKVNTDILISLISTIVKKRWILSNQYFNNKDKDLKSNKCFPLRLVIMSATMETESFNNAQELFETTPAFVEIPHRQFPVTIFFSKVTPEDYIEASYKKAVKIVTTLPQGNILVFLTGQHEINLLVQRLRIYLKSNSSYFDKETYRKDKDYVLVFPLYSMLEDKYQQRVFKTYPQNIRLIIVSTNVAETSVTLPGIKYVIDCGKSKAKSYLGMLGSFKMEINPISKASADQRSGRAGRLGHGYCYRLYSPSFYSKMTEFTPPEILNVPLDQVILFLKSIGVLDVTQFPMITKPNPIAFITSLQRLQILGAIKESQEKNNLSCFQDSILLEKMKLGNFSDNSHITKLGIEMSKYPLSPPFSKMLVLLMKTNVLLLGIIMISCLSVNQLLMEAIWDKQNNLEENDDENIDNYSEEEISLDVDTIKLQAILDKKMEEKRKHREEASLARKRSRDIHKKWASSQSDLIVCIKIVGGFLSTLNNNLNSTIEELSQKYSKDNFIYQKSLLEIISVASQLLEMADSTVKKEQTLNCLKQIKPPTNSEELLLIQVLTAGLISNIAKKVEIPGTKKIKYQVISGEEAQIHGGSICFDSKPEWIVYSEIIKKGERNYIRNVSAINPSWIYTIGGTMVTKSKMLPHPAPTINKITGKVIGYFEPKFSPMNWPLPIVKEECDLS